MKKSMLLIGTLCGMLLLAGCGNGADENKTPDQIRQEVTSMTVEDIQDMVEKYQKAIEKKTAELKDETDKLKAIPLTEQLGDEAKKIQSGIADLSVSIGKLKDNMKAYADSLSAKK